MFCTACAVANPSGASRCRECGGRLERAPTAVAAVPRRPAVALLAVAPVLAVIAVVAAYTRAEQGDLARHYAQAKAAAAAGDYDAALDAFAAAADYRDAAARRAALAAELAPAADAYARGAVALDDGRYDEAIAALEPVVARLPTYLDAADLLAEARRLRAADLRRRADAAEARRDWLAAEAALAALAAADPGDAVLAERLATLRRRHAPLVFVRDLDLYLVGPDGADERRLAVGTPATRPVWSPDRSRIAFVSPGGGGRDAAALYVVDADGSDPRRVSETAHPYAVAAWSPDGARIAYTSVADFDLRTGTGLLAVHVVDVATGRDEDVTGRTGRHAMTPTWSPTGDRLAVVGRPRLRQAGRDATDGPGDVVVFSLAGGAATDLTAGRVPDVVRAIWSPTDERLLVFARSSPISGSTISTTDRLFELDARTGRLTPVAAAVDAASVAWAPAWSPDGTRYAFVDGPLSVAIRERDGRETRVETDHPLSGAVTWSPDGAALLAVAADARQPSVIIDLGADGPTTSEVPIAYDPDWPTGTPQWSPPRPALAAPPAAGAPALNPSGGAGLED